MILIFEFKNYRKYLAKKISEFPNKGYGQMSKLADFMGVHTTLVSQVLNEYKNLTVDQAVMVTEYFGLNELESEYFISLVQYEKTGTPAAKLFFEKKMLKLKESSKDLSKRLKSEYELKEEHRAIFYSDWAYSAIRQSIALPGINTIENISTYLGLSRKKVQKYMDFLLKVGLCRIEADKFKIGPSSTYVDSNSSWVRVHHSNWRQRALLSFDKNDIKNLHYTSPLTISEADSEIIREKIVQFIEQVNIVVDPSPSEKLFCLNIDWFQEGRP